MNLNHTTQDELINEALKIGGFKTKKETIYIALREFINRRKQLEIIDLFGKLDPDADYDYKQGRNR
jgi:Bacterial antitoxin of type II TA system, VapB